MSHHYYIIEDNEKFGPFDIITMIKKIKNGSVKEDTVVSDKTGITRKAVEFEDLSELINEANGNAANVIPTFRNVSVHLDLNRSLSFGWRFVVENQMSVAYAGLFLAVLLVVGFGLSYIPFIGYITAFVLGFILYSAYFLYVLRVSRGQHIDFSYIYKKLTRNAHSLAIAGLITTIVFSASLALSVYFSYYLMILTIPGLFVWTGLVFTPLLILEGDVDFQTAMHLSKNRVKALPMDSIGVLFGLVVINYIGAVCLLAPLVFTLPITLGALVEIYEELFSH